jgi:hypothetical protein
VFSTSSSTGALLWVVTALNLTAMSCALWAAIMARSYLRALRKKLAERATRSLHQLDAEVTELTSSISKLSVTTRRISSRIGMQDVRARARSTSSPSLSSDPKMRKAQIREALATGQMRVVNDSQSPSSGQITGGINGADGDT